jgi:endoglucanase
VLRLRERERVCSSSGVLVRDGLEKGTILSRVSLRELVPAMTMVGCLLLPGAGIGAGALVPGDPFAGAKLFVDPSSNASRQVTEWRATRPEDAQRMEKIASTSNADWFTGGSGRAFREQVVARTRQIIRAGALPVYVLYDIPRRDCGAYSAGGAKTGAAYRRWIDGFASAIGKRKAVVVLEPDALPGLDCLSKSARTTRYALIHYAVDRLARNSHAVLYLDAGNSAWQSPSVMARRLRKAGVARARGFALNVSNYQTTEASIAYGNRLARLLGRKHFIVDTSRNGLGPWNGREYWCNPPGRALGLRPTARTVSRLADAYLWIKLPGESDGTCKGGPPSGQWWPEYALGLAERASW